MKVVFSAFVLVGALVAHSGAHAQGSTLRVACKGKDIGAEVSINGQFKGECPLDAQVRAGTVKLRLVKKVDALREQVFEQDIRIGSGVLKQIDVVLPEPRLTAQAQRSEGARLASEAAEAAKREQARQAELLEAQRRESERVAAEAAEAAKREQTRLAGLTEEQRRDEALLAQQRQAAAAGNPSAMALLGARYETGQGVAQSDEQAVNWYRKSAEAGDAAGMAGLGAMYYYGTGLPSMMPKYYGTKEPENEAQARIWWSKAAEAGNSRAIYGMGNLHFFGQAGLPEDKTLGVAWYEKAVAAGEQPAMVTLGTHYLSEDNHERALFYYRMASDAGSTEGMIGLAYMHGNGKGVAKDESEALSWYRKAAATGSSDGKYMVGVHYADGKVVAQDSNEAASWFRKAGAGNLSEWAVEDMWKRYAEGKGVPKDEAEAEIWRRRMLTGTGSTFADTNRKIREQARAQQEKAAAIAAAAAAADAPNMLATAERYASSRDVAQAVLWYRKAADAGNVAAMAKLGWHYENGNGVIKDLMEATTWYRKAAEAGDIVGMAGYGEMLFIGTGSSYSSGDQARIWWSKAADAGNGRALNGMGKLYFYGSGGLAQSTELAIVSFEKAVEAGEPAGRTNIATLLQHYPSARRFLKNQNILQARSPSPVNATNATAAVPQTAQPPASSGSGFFGAMFGGAISTLVDRNTAVMNSAIASSGGVAAGALTSANTALARETKEQIARSTGGNGSMEGMAGAAVGSALASGSTAGAVAAFSGASSNLAAAGGGNSNSGNSGGDNWSGVRNEISGLMGQSRTAGNSSAQSLAGASAVVGSCSTAASGGFADQLQGRFNKYKNDGQCGPIVQSAEALRVKALANCKAGDTKSADIIYGTQYLRQMVPYVKSACP